MMDEAFQSFPKAFAVTFAQINRWDPNSFHGIKWHWPSSVMAPIGSVLKPRKEKVDRSGNGFASLMPITIHFDGSIEPRKISEDKEYTMELFWARPGDVVASKIDLKNGAVAIIPDGWDNAVVTNHFAVYEPDLKRLDPKYFHLLIQANFFREHLWRNKVGAEGRKEVKLDFFESLEFPIPPLPVQQKIVAHWEAAQLEQSQLFKKEQKLIKESQSNTLALLGIKKTKGKPVGKMFCLPWKDSERWSYEYNKRVLAGLSSVVTGTYPTITLNSICSGVSGSTPSKKCSEYWADGTLPWVSPKDMKTRLITDSIDHISDKAVKERQAPVVSPGSILFVVRSGILQHTVPVAMTDISVSINQDIRAFTPNTENVLAEYLLAYFEAKQDELLRLVKWSTTVQSINKEELEAFPIPLPPLSKQNEIVSTVRSYHVEIDSLRQNRNAWILSAEREIEKMILGTRPVEDH